MAMDKTLQAVLAATGSFFAITVIFASVYLLCKGAKSKSTGSRRTNRTTQLTRITVDESASFDPSLKVSMDEVVKATKNFNKDLVVGDGGFGLVYKAQLSDGLKVAIKKLDPDAFQGFREFRAEMETLGQIRHPNLVKILGYCVSGADRILIYEFMERGNLDRWLHDSSSTDFDGYDDTSGCKLPLSWKTRNKIVRGVANALAFLHSLEKPIIHRDIKASNVLLDREYEAHIADFGLARSIDTARSHVSTQFAGTMGYMPPEYKEGFTGATVKADVFSFGILMLEVATGRRPNLPSVFDGKEMGLVEWARKMVAQNRQMEMVDPSISREDLDEGNVKKYFEIAGECAHETSRQRPLMKDVIELLKELPT
ncbi:phytosulfokine receptor 2 [Rosa rugosa]|uniref:phytosulfokine receptor 2 n=1 Tax=Rosa rugosa TaxID=74645 RepID=UPI002B40D4D7|nr:phytosulfokine receptor 2 [Rosa rugosa]